MTSDVLRAQGIPAGRTAGNALGISADVVGGPRAAAGGPASRTGYVLARYPKLSETFILNEILGLEAAGRQLDIFSLQQPMDRRYHADLARVQADVHYLPDPRPDLLYEALAAVRDLGPEAASRLDRALQFVEPIRDQYMGVLLKGLHLAGYVLNRGITHLHAHFMTRPAYTAYVGHLLTGVPFTVTTHAVDLYAQNVDWVRFSQVAARAEAVITVCDANVRYLKERLADTDLVNVVRVYNGLALDDSAPLDLPRDPKLVLAVGRLVPKKGFDVLVDACSILRDRGVSFHCVILGDGDERPALESAIADADLGDVIRMPGPVPNHEVRMMMTRARVLAAPCVVGTNGDSDALPTVLIEALASGLPSVTTPLAGIPEIVEHGREGLLVPERNPGVLADSIERLLTDDALWSSCSAAAPVKAKRHFAQDVTAPQLLEVFDRAERAVAPPQVATG